MSKKLYVGNLPWKATEQSLTDMFSEYGDVEEVIIIKDRMSGRSKGFGFVTFADDAAADAALSGAQGKEFEGRPLKLDEAKPQQD